MKMCVCVCVHSALPRSNSIYDPYAGFLITLTQSPETGPDGDLSIPGLGDGAWERAGPCLGGACSFGEPPPPELHSYSPHKHTLT